jgi:hypothetical protein
VGVGVGVGVGSRITVLINQSRQHRVGHAMYMWSSSSQQTLRPLRMDVHACMARALLGTVKTSFMVLSMSCVCALLGRF